MSEKDPGGGTATGDLIAIGPLRWGLSQAYLCVFYIGLLSLLAPLLPKVLSAPKAFLWYFNDDQEKEVVFPKLRVKMDALHRQLLVLFVAMSGILLLPLGVIIQPGLSAENSSIGTGVYSKSWIAVTDPSSRPFLLREPSKLADAQAHSKRLC